jgi:hypothetical protein
MDGFFGGDGFGERHFCERGDCILLRYQPHTGLVRDRRSGGCMRHRAEHESIDAPVRRHNAVRAFVRLAGVVECRCDRVAESGAGILLGLHERVGYSPHHGRR